MPGKVVILTEIISPYRIPVFNHVAKNLKEHFLVIFYGKPGKRRLWKINQEEIRFNYKLLSGISFRRKNSTPHFFNFTILCKLLKYSPDVIIIGAYHHPSSLLALLYAKLFKRRVILWCESNKYDKRSNYRVKEAYKTWFVKNCTEYLAVGKASFEYLILLGADAGRIWVAPDAVDNEFFSKACDKERKRGNAFKQSKGYPEKLILYVGRLIDQKGIPDLLKAFQVLSKKNSDLGLVLVGSGDGESRYKHFCEVNNLKNVFFEGFVPQEDLPAYYAAADVFILPTHSDPWGLVLNEAMACGLPVISTNVAGAARDLIYQGKNGYIYEKGNMDELIKSLERVLNGNKERMGQKSYEIVQSYSPEKCAQGFVEAIMKTDNTAYPDVTWLRDELGVRP